MKGDPKRLKSIRLELGLSQAKIATLLGVETNTFARWERGEPIPPKVAELAAEYLSITHRKGGRDE